MSEEKELLRDISKKLDQIVVLTKLSNKHAIDEFKKKIRRDKVASKILETADGSLTYSDLSEKVATDLGIAKITVKKRISTLKELGILIINRKGKESYYENSGLLD
jgi:biotin operon repressor